MPAFLRRDLLLPGRHRPHAQLSAGERKGEEGGKAVLLGLAAALFFLLRGVVLLSFFPLGEGWDEYQHVAYVQFLVEKHAAPRLVAGQPLPRVSPALLAALVRYPLPGEAVAQINGTAPVAARAAMTKPLGPAFGYDSLPQPPPALLPLENPVWLYQAQHGPLAYELMKPLYEAAGGVDNLPRAILVLRSVNLGYGVLAVGLAAWAIARLLRPGWFAALVVALLSCQPLLLLNSVRVANDPLAVLLGTVVIVAMLTGRRWSWGKATLLGSLTALAILAKTTNLFLVPFVLGWWGLQSAGMVARVSWPSRFSGRQQALLLATFSLGVLLTLLPEAAARRQAGASLLGTQETTLHAPTSLAAWGEALGTVAWGHELSRRLLRHSLFVGGWSRVRAPGSLVQAHQYLLLLCLLGVGVTGVRRWWPPVPPVSSGPQAARAWGLPFRRPGVGLALLLLVGLVLVQLACHMLVTQATLHHVATNVWYLAVVFPWLLVLLAVAARGWGQTGTLLLLLLLTGVFVATEISGWQRMRRLYHPPSHERIVKNSTITIEMVGIFGHDYNRVPC